MLSLRIALQTKETLLCDEKYEHGVGGFEMNL
jgi:hypothetical protein